MIILLSPAKSLKFNSELPQALPISQPCFIEQAQHLIELLKVKTPAEIASLMKLSDSLATLNYNRFQEWKPEHDSRKSATFPSGYMFDGDVYKGLDIESLNEQSLQRLNIHLRHLSGLYGILKPFDTIFPYRLEMGTKLNNDFGANLYALWKPIIANYINQELEKINTSEKFIVNCASNEYFKAVDKKQLKYPVISPEFKDYKNGTYKVISFFAKRARGMMARHLVQSGCTLKNITKFNMDGYEFNAEMSNDSQPVFTRRID